MKKYFQLCYWHCKIRKEQIPLPAFESFEVFWIFYFFHYITNKLVHELLHIVVGFEKYLNLKRHYNCNYKTGISLRNPYQIFKSPAISLLVSTELHFVIESIHAFMPSFQQHEI